MPRLYIEAYTRALSGKTVCVACRQGILRDYFREIVADIKFLDRQGIRTILYHNMPNRFANQKVFREMGVRLPETEVERVLPDDDFYRHVLDREKRVHKLVFIERKALMDRQGHIINAITTPEVRAGIRTRGDWIANVNFKGALERICDQIDARQYDRVHILPAGKHSIKHELFTIEGHGTLIANNYVECFKPMGAKEDMRLVDGILRLYRSQGFLKRRTNEYLREHRKNFYVTLIDGIVVGCVEKKIIDPRTVEIAALAISTKFRNQRVGVFMIKAFIQEMRRHNFSRFICLTNNPKLQQLLGALGFEPCQRPEYGDRQAQSPDVAMFLKKAASF
jgi:amino-acid N-acetyltransferase